MMRTKVRRYTLDIFLERAEAAHDKKFNYSQVKEHHINGAESNVPITCNVCYYEWEPTINNHLNGKRGCPDCAGNAPWTLQRFLTKAKKIHGDKYDYSCITEDHIKNSKSRIPIICRNCQDSLLPDISHHINRKSGCQRCCFNKGSKVALEWLKSIEEREGIIIQCSISPMGEFRIRTPNGRHYKADGYHASTNTIYEYYGDYWHGNPKIYNLSDINKTKKKSYGELYQRTIDRENYIKSLGYNLVIKWGTDFDVHKFLLSFDEVIAKLNTGDFLFFKFSSEYQVIPHDSRNYIATFYEKDGNIYLVQLQYNQVTCQISPPV